MAIASSIVAAGFAGAAGLGASKIAANSQTKYANTQQQIADTTGARLTDIYNRTGAMVAPQIDLGASASSALGRLLNLDTAGGGSGGSPMELFLGGDQNSALKNEALDYFRRAGTMDLAGPRLTYDQLTKLPGWDAMVKAGNDAVVQSAYASGKSGGGVLSELADRARRDAYSVYNTELDRQRQGNLDIYNQLFNTGGSLYGVYGDEYARNRTSGLDAYNALSQLIGGGANTALNLGQIGSGNATTAGNFQANVPAGGSTLGNALGFASGYFSGQGGQDLLGGLGEWWKNRNQPTMVNKPSNSSWLGATMGMAA